MLEPFTVLVGPNGAGKSNLLNALRMVSEIANRNAADVMRDFGGIDAINCRVAGARWPLGFRILCDSPIFGQADFSLEIESDPFSATQVAWRERCYVRRTQETAAFGYYRCGNEFIENSTGTKPLASTGQLSLVTAFSGWNNLGAVLQILRNVRYYSFKTDQIRKWQVPDSGEYLRSDGSNAAAVLRKIASEKSESSEYYKRIGSLLSHIVSGVSRVESVRSEVSGEFDLGSSTETVLFQKSHGNGHLINFQAADMSEGTLRSLAILLAAYQVGYHPVIAIEDPELAIHPGAAEVIFQVLKGISLDRQVIIATQSADLIDLKEVEDSFLRVVEMDNQGRTLVGPVTPAIRDVIRDRLFYAGELLRSNELTLAIDAAADAISDFDLFGPLFPGTEQTA